MMTMMTMMTMIKTRGRGSSTSKSSSKSSLLSLVCLLLGVSVSLVHATNPFSSNVVALTSQNWRSEVLESPHAVIVNICRVG
jgi:hypothetical protein